MDPKEIFELIVKADEALKYATEEKAAARAQQARTWLLQARQEAAAIGNEDLVKQADQRLADLDQLTSSRGEPGGRPESGPVPNRRSPKSPSPGRM